MTLLTNVLQLWRPGQYIKPHVSRPPFELVLVAGQHLVVKGIEVKL